MKITNRRDLTSILALALLIGCADVPTPPDAGSEPPAERRTAGALGVMEITISGIGSSEGLSASARSVDPAAAAPGAAPRSLNPVEDGTRSGIQLEPLSTGSFTEGERLAGGVRYLSASFRVRNADTAGDAYTTALDNLTFLAVATGSTLEGSAVSALRLFDGTGAPSALAADLLPTGWVRRGFGGLESNEPDVLQILTEDEVGAIAAPAGVTTVFPYGFVVRSPAVTPGSRELPASPDLDQFDGVVTFAFKLPLQPTAGEDPFEISIVVLPVSDDATRVTQSFEEQSPAGQAALEARVAALAAGGVTLLPGGDYGGAVATRRICEVRTAGGVGAPTAFLIEDPDFLALDPDPYATDGSASFIADNATFATDFDATFDATVSGVDDGAFVVRSFQRGKRFVGGSYSGNGTSTVTSPVGSFFPGETVEITLTGQLGDCVVAGRVARYRVATAAASGGFGDPPEGPFGAGDAPVSVALGDLDGDGRLDAVTANELSNDATVFLGDGSGGMAEATAAGSPHTVGALPKAVALGDVDGDGDLDLVTADAQVDQVTVLPGDGSGGFSPAAGSSTPVGDGPFAVALGDLNGDGHLDLATANSASNDVTALLGDGSGAFTEATAAGSPFAVGADPRSVAVGDVDDDGKLDLVTANSGADDATVLLGDGNGGFVEATAAGSPFPVGDTPLSVTLGDVDRDGNLDLATANGLSNDATVLLGDGTGGFAEATAAGSPFAVGGLPRSVALGDVDGDGDLDLVTADELVDAATVLLGDGTGAFTPAAGSPVSAANGPNSVALGDVDGDGDLDLVVANYHSDDVTVHLGQP